LFQAKYFIKIWDILICDPTETQIIGRLYTILLKILVTGGAGFVGRYLVDFLLMNHEVTIYDNAGLWKRITGFTIDVFTIKDNPDTLISSTKWNSLRDFKGSVTIGGSIVIHSENQPADNSTMFVRIKLKSVEYFIEKT